ncbi:MAG: SPOR domain-containing protein [Chitinophagaceae bacterium]|nr:SPOR domain-containing protein [Chitinophagaceae bacterium]
MKNSIIILLVLASLAGRAQTDTGSVIVRRDPRIDLLIRKQAQINEETTRSSRRSGPGYRIQVISTTDRSKAIAAKTRIYQVYPELKPYFLYQSPYYRLKVGNFKTYAEAEDYISPLTREFPGTVFVVKDTIERDPLDGSEGMSE